MHSSQCRDWLRNKSRIDKAHTTRKQFVFNDRARAPKHSSHFYILIPTLRQAWSRKWSVTAMCVQDIDDQCVLQITLILAVCCALHRLASQVIHRIGLFFSFRVLPKSKACRKTNNKIQDAISNLVFWLCFCRAFQQQQLAGVIQVELNNLYTTQLAERLAA